MEGGIFDQRSPDSFQPTRESVQQNYRSVLDVVRKDVPGVER